jgi:hypothetical protein
MYRERKNFSIREKKGDNQQIKHIMAYSDF